MFLDFRNRDLKQGSRRRLRERCLNIERLSYDLEKEVAVCFADQCLARLKQNFSLFPPKKLLMWEVNSSIAHSHYCISNDVKAKLSRKFYGETVTLSASAFAKPMKIRARLFLFDKPIKCFAVLFTFCFYVYFSRSYESRSNIFLYCNIFVIIPRRSALKGRVHIPFITSNLSRREGKKMYQKANLLLCGVLACSSSLMSRSLLTFHTDALRP